MTKSIDTYISFLDSFFKQIEIAGLEIEGLILDHVAYQASSAEDYDKLKIKFRLLGKEIDEEIIGGRRVSVFKLNDPLLYKKYTIPVLELIEPKEGQVCQSAFQHAEFIFDRPFEELMSKYPSIQWDTSSMNRASFSHLKLNFENGLTLKFLKAPILELVSKE